MKKGGSAMKKYIALALIAAAAVLIVLSMVIPDSPIWVSVAGLVLAVVAIIVSPKKDREQK